MLKNNVLITGTSGLLGSQLKKQLKRDFNATGISRSYVPDYVDMTIDITNYNSIKKIMFQLNPNVVIHCAALSSHLLCKNEPELAKKVNFYSTLNLVKISQEIGAKFIFISSDAVFRGDRGWYDELDTPDPFSYYGELKLLAEEEIKKITNDFVILRGSFFGRSLNKNSSIFDFFYNNILDKNTINGYIDIISTSIDIHNLTKIIKTFIKIGARGLYHYGSSNKYSKYELGLEVAKIGNLDPLLIQPVRSQSLSIPFNEPRDLSLSPRKIKNISGIIIPTLEDCVKNVYKYL